jgi:adenylate kinase family enzyme/SAM-dependent methyltransferase
MNRQGKMNVNATPWTPSDPSGGFGHDQGAFEVQQQEFMYAYPTAPFSATATPFMFDVAETALMTHTAAPPVLGIKGWEIGESTPPIPSASFAPADIPSQVKSYRDMAANTHYVLLRDDCSPDSEHIYSGFVIPIHDLTEVEVDALWFGLAKQVFGNQHFREHNVYGVSLCKRVRNNDLLIMWCPQPAPHLYHDLVQKIQQQLHVHVFAAKASRLQPKVQFHLDIFSTVSRRVCTVLLTGAPGSGKSTIGRQLASKLQFAWFSAAEALRGATDQLRQSQEAFKPWELQKLTYDRLSAALEDVRSNPGIRGIVLDCQGKTLEDHYYLDSLLRTKCMPLCAAINFNVDVDREEELVDRVCNKGNPRGGRGTQDPRAKQDKERLEAMQRDRLRAHRQTEGRILQLYVGCEVLFTVDAMRSKDDVLMQLEGIVTKVFRNVHAIAKSPDYPLESHSLTFVDDYDEYAGVMDNLIRLTNAKKPVFPGTMISGYMSRATLEAKGGQLWEYKVSHKVEGLRFLLVLHMNKLYCVPRHMRSVYSLNVVSWTGTPLHSLQDFVLDAELTYLNSMFGLEKLIVFDVLAWNGMCTVRLDWDSRQSHIACIPDELSVPSPHANVGIVVVRKHFYVPYEIQELLRGMWLDYPVDGLLFTHKKQYRLSFDEELIHWKNPLSLTSDFRVGRITPKGGVFQVVLEVQEQVSEHPKVPNSCRMRWRNTDYKEEFVEIEPQVFRHVQLTVGDIIECMLIKDPGQSHHYWEFLRKRPDKQIANTKEVVETVVRDGMVTANELIEFFHHAPYVPAAQPTHPPTHYADVQVDKMGAHVMAGVEGAVQCMQCGSVNNRGRRDPENKKYYCPSCWEKYGYGDCRQCLGQFYPGQLDPHDGRFYCYPCWDTYKTTPKVGLVKTHEDHEDPNRGLVMRPQKATYAPASGDVGEESPYKELINLVRAQLIKEAHSLIRSKAKETRVLEIGCGKADDLKKWVFMCEIAQYAGTDVDPTNIEEARSRGATILSQLAGDGSSKKGSTKAPVPNIDFIEADIVAKRFWLEILPDRWPELFHVISCPFSIHNAFRDVRTAYAVLQGIADSLEPEGVFIGSLVDDSEIYNRYLRQGKKFGNEKYSLQVEDSMGIGIGSKYKISVRGVPDASEFVVPWERFVQIASHVGLQVVPAYSRSFLDRVRSMAAAGEGADAVPQISREDEEYISLLRTFMLSKPKA